MQIETKQSPYWGLWGTIGFSLLILFVFTVVQTVVSILYVSSQVDGQSSEAMMSALSSNGDALSIAEIISALVSIVLTFLFIYWRKQYSIEDYLSLHPVSFKVLLTYLGQMVIFIVLVALLSIISDHPTPQIMFDLYHSATYTVLLWFALIIAAPFFEEILFRGFLFEGLRHSPLGLIWAAVLSSALWAGIHLQYGLYEIVIIFFMGLFFAYVKMKSGSLYVPIALHILMNLLATVEIALNLG